MQITEKKPKKMFVGEVISDKMDKTVVVRMVRTYTHPVFQKTLRKYKKFKVHDEQGVAKEGDIVEFYEGRPTSKTKFMYLARVVKALSRKQA